jgi:hypothetical protein
MDKLRFTITSIVGLVIVTLVLSPAIVPIHFWLMSVLLTTVIAWKLSWKSNQIISPYNETEDVKNNDSEEMNQLKWTNLSEEGVSKILYEYHHKLVTHLHDEDSGVVLIIEIDPEVHFVQASGDRDSFVIEASSNDLGEDVTSEFVQLGWMQAPHGNFCPKEGMVGAFCTPSVGYHEGSNEYSFTAFLTGYLLTDECSKFVFDTFRLYGKHNPESSGNLVSYRIFF